MDIRRAEKPVIGRPNHKQRAVTASLRRRIVEGALAPGSQLPTRPKLMREYGVSSVTMQRALDELVDEGFVAARPRLGTFVSAHPPHRSRFALAFPRLPDGDQPGAWQFSRFWTALADAAREMNAAKGRRVEVYTGVNGHADAEDHIRLMADVAASRLAGILFIDPFPYSLFIAQSKLPCASFVARAELPGLNAVMIEMAEVLDRAVADLVAKGRRKIAFLLSEWTLPGDLEALSRAVSRHGAQTREAWTLGLSLRKDQWASHAVQTLMLPEGDRRPDGLVVADDHLVPAAMAGLARAGVKIGTDLDVVAYTNHGCSPRQPAPVRELGFVAADLLARALDQLEAAARTGQTQPLIRIAPAFAEELADPAAHPAADVASSAARREPAATVS